jgi:hypothetical protein
MWYRYGVELHLLQESPNNEENLALLLHLSHSLKHKKGETFQGFDWFVATVFVLCGGNMERCVCVYWQKIISSCFIHTLFICLLLEMIHHHHNTYQVWTYNFCFVPKRFCCNMYLVSQLCNLYCDMLGLDSAVSIVTCYGLDGPGIES